MNSIILIRVSVLRHEEKVSVVHLISNFCYCVEHFSNMFNIICMKDVQARGLNLKGKTV